MLFYQEEGASILLGDCLDELKTSVGQVDLVLADPPYGTTSCKWDSVIDLQEMWSGLRKVTQESTPIVLMAAQPFTSHLIMSNIKEFRYVWVWDKKVPSGMSYCRYQPMRRHEDICVFSRKSATYFPQMAKRKSPIRSGGMSKHAADRKQDIDWKPVDKTYDDKYPTSILEFTKVRRGARHKTQKPVDLMEYLIRTYTKPGDTVLDFCFGSGTTGVAAKKTGRKFVGIEIEQEFCEIAIERLLSEE